MVIWRMIVGLIVGLIGGQLFEIIFYGVILYSLALRSRFHLLLCYIHPVSDEELLSALQSSTTPKFLRSESSTSKIRQLYLWIPYIFPLVRGHYQGGSIAEHCTSSIFCCLFGAGLSLTLVELLYFLLGWLSNIFTFSVVCPLSLL